MIANHHTSPTRLGLALGTLLAAGYLFGSILDGGVDAFSSGRFGGAGIGLVAASATFGSLLLRIMPSPPVRRARTATLIASVAWAIAMLLWLTALSYLAQVFESMD